MRWNSQKNSLWANSIRFYWNYGLKSWFFFLCQTHNVEQVLNKCFSVIILYYTLSCFCEQIKLLISLIKFQSQHVIVDFWSLFSHNNVRNIDRKVNYACVIRRWMLWKYCFVISYNQNPIINYLFSKKNHKVNLFSFLLHFLDVVYTSTDFLCKTAKIQLV